MLDNKTVDGLHAVKLPAMAAALAEQSASAPYAGLGYALAPRGLHWLTTVQLTTWSAGQVYTWAMLGVLSYSSPESHVSAS